MATIRKISQEKIDFSIFLVDLLDRKKCQTEKPQLKLINFQIVNQGYVPSFRERTMQFFFSGTPSVIVLLKNQFGLGFPTKGNFRKK